MPTHFNIGYLNLSPKTRYQLISTSVKEDSWLSSVTLVTKLSRPDGQTHRAVPKLSSSKSSRQWLQEQVKAVAAGVVVGRKYK
jgi:hypothetical protein